MPRTITPHTRRDEMRGQGRVYQRGTIWWIEFYHNGEQVRISSRSTKRKVALDLLNQRLRERDEGLLTHAQAGRKPFSEVFAAYEQDLALRNVRSLDGSIRPHLKPLKQFFGNYRLDQCTKSLLDRYKTQRKASGKAIATINTELRFLRAALRFAQQTYQLARVPTIQLLPGEHIRQGFFEWHELQAILPHLPAHIQPAIELAFWVGWRKREVLTLEWQDVDWQHGVLRLRPIYSKTDEGRSVGISGAIREILEHQWAARVVDDRIVPYVFHRNGQPLRNIDKAWQKARAASRLDGKLIHDFRRTAARNMIFAGAPEKVAMQVTGHKTRAVFDRYVIVPPEQTQQALEQMAAFVNARAQKIEKLDTKGEKRHAG